MQKSNRGRKLDFLPLFFFTMSNRQLSPMYTLLCFLLYFPYCFSSPCYVLALSFVVNAVFFADLPILLPSVGLSLLLCVIIHLSVFRVSEVKK